jgi:hypothetical protein
MVKSAHGLHFVLHTTVATAVNSMAGFADAFEVLPVEIRVGAAPVKKVPAYRCLRSPFST